VLFFPLLLIACSDGDSSSENSSDASTMVTEDGAIVTIESTELTAGDAASVTYNLGSEEITGTIHWGDGHTTRIRGSGTVRHGYDIASSYLVGLQVDGGESSRIGVIVVAPEPEPQPEPPEPSRVAIPPSTVTFSCFAGSSARVSSASTGAVYVLTVVNSGVSLVLQARDISGGTAVDLPFTGGCGLSTNIIGGIVINGISVNYESSLIAGTNPEWTVTIN